MFSVHMPLPELMSMSKLMTFNLNPKFNFPGYESVSESISEPMSVSAIRTMDQTVLYLGLVLDLSQVQKGAAR